MVKNPFSDQVLTRRDTLGLIGALGATAFFGCGSDSSSATPADTPTVGVYSDEASGGIQSKNTLGETYLRGYQLTDANGGAEFLTIYPVWYAGRTIHIHFKIRTYPTGGQQTSEFTSQLFIDDALNDVVLANAPYNTRGQRTVRNANDGIYNGGGPQLTLDLEPASEGYASTFTIGLEMS